jgi:hypothetical protein
MAGVRVGVLAAAVCATAALVGAGAASANKVRVNAADQATATRAVLKLADLPPIAAWKRSGDPSSAQKGGSLISCPGYHPKSSDLVTTGEASSDFEAPGTAVQSDVTMLATPAMVELDWARTFNARFLPCLRQMFEKDAGAKLQIISLRKMPFPKVSSHAAAYRLVYGLTYKGKAMRGAADFIVVAGHRIEITLFLVANLGPASGAAAGEAGMTIIERQLASVMAGRVLAPDSSQRFTA